MIGITLTDLAIAGGLVALLGLASMWQRLSIAGDLLVASVRTKKGLRHINMPWPTMLFAP